MFAIVMTLLVLELHVPIVETAELQEALIELLPNLLIFFISFGMLGLIWIGHRLEYIFIRQTDQTIHWITVLFLAFVALVPFTTALLAEHPDQHLAICIFGGNILLITLVMLMKWKYAVKGRRLVGKDFDESLIRWVTVNHPQTQYFLGFIE